MERSAFVKKKESLFDYFMVSFFAKMMIPAALHDLFQRLNISDSLGIGLTVLVFLHAVFVFYLIVIFIVYAVQVAKGKKGTNIPATPAGSKTPSLSKTPKTPKTDKKE